MISKLPFKLKPVSLFFLLISFLFAGIATPLLSKAAEPPSAAYPIGNTAISYKAYWGGIYIGDMIGEVRNNGDHSYAFTLILRSKGIVKLASHYTSTTKSVIKQQGNQFIPQHYEGQAFYRNKTKLVNIRYTENGHIEKEILTPPENIKKRPLIVASLKEGSVDPLTAALLARQHVYAYLHNNGAKAFSLRLYEGKRLSMLRFTIHGREMLEEKPVIHFSFTRDPLAGFTKKELHTPEQDPTIDIYLSDDEAMLPVKATGKAIVGSVTAIFEKTCATLQGCL